jgi:Cu/Ag efflux protein CusF
MRHVKLLVTICAAVLLCTAVAGAQKTVTQGAEVSETVTIEAIDYKARLVTLKDSEGTSETVYAGPEIQRFDALKVGDKVTFRYYESVVYQIRKPGTQAAAKPTEAAGIVRSEGAKPGGTVSQQKTATVTVDAVDLAVPSVSIRTDDGRKMSFRVDNKKNLEGVKAGDRVEITYTQALAISVK